MGIMEGLKLGAALRGASEAKKIRKELQRANELLREKEEVKVKEIICPHCGQRIVLDA